MITRKQRKDFTKAVGTRYVKRVRAILEEKKVLSKEGKPYSDSTIKHVFNGSFSNEAIEDALFQVCREAKEKHLNPRVF
jgi:hypothetical protein